MQVRPEGGTLTRADSSGPNVSAQEHSLPENYIKVGLCVHNISVICIIYTVYTITLLLVNAEHYGRAGANPKEYGNEIHNLPRIYFRQVSREHNHT